MEALAEYGPGMIGVFDGMVCQTWDGDDWRLTGWCASSFIHKKLLRMSI